MNRHDVPTPCYVVSLPALDRNLEVLGSVQKRTGCRILLALKAFAMPAVAGRISAALSGTSASSLHEARLGKECFGGEVHACVTAYRDDEYDGLLSLVEHVVFNSFSQWERFGPRALSAGKRCGIRINPEHSEVEVPIYDPCGPGSRLGVRRRHFREELLDGVSGLHFHTLCEKNADALSRTLSAVEARFGDLIPRMEWVNFGGGHHITRPDYDLDLLCSLVTGFSEKYGVTVYLEPGEAVALNAGILTATVLDVVPGDPDVAILDASAAAHMPDVLEMPYRPEVMGAGKPGEKSHTYRLAGCTCLSGDVIGLYSFDRPLAVGDRLFFGDMAIYTMVKNNTFNGLRLPSIAVEEADGSVSVVRSFGYGDYKNRLS
ncbi:MAG: carboxynorspermidine decarboxylase [Deltaproteobacteria bacterium]|nr:carboxynorspermidine decarboxylase [Deltaproteobacteria bacterium]